MRSVLDESFWRDFLKLHCTRWRKLQATESEQFLDNFAELIIDKNISSRSNFYFGLVNVVFDYRKFISKHMFIRQKINQ